ncbi:hypothetical protein AB0M29_40535 [Streptomyces sp. NPDC051976]|uniref:hypothetical protein n=1 Tax=Streptomyces sp. NPDC051976 TaxID=3154947 RepID=UPI0034493363
MTRTTLPAAVALAASTALLLTACGGGGSDSSDKIQPSGTGTPSETATPSATKAAVQRPVISLPAGAKNVFENQQSGDPKKDAVLADNAQWVNSMDEAILKGSSHSTAIGFYSTDKGLEAAVSYVQGYLNKNNTWIGITRFFDRKVTFGNDGSASLIYCSDESKAFLKNRKTGKVDNTPTTADSYVLYNTRLVKSPQGVWQTVAVVSDRGAKQCQP